MSKYSKRIQCLLTKEAWAIEAEDALTRQKVLHGDYSSLRKVLMQKYRAGEWTQLLSFLDMLLKEYMGPASAVSQVIYRKLQYVEAQMEALRAVETDILIDALWGKPTDDLETLHSKQDWDILLPPILEILPGLKELDAYRLQRDPQARPIFDLMKDYGITR